MPPYPSIKMGSDFLALKKTKKYLPQRCRILKSIIMEAEKRLFHLTPAPSLILEAFIWDKEGE
jgi:hypothetical protein